MTRTILVTGGNRGIGLATAHALAKLGNSVLIGSRSQADGEAVADSLRKEGLDVSSVQLDLSNPASIDSAIAEIEKSGKNVDVLVNNAGVYQNKQVLDLTDEEIADSLAVHLTGPIRLIRLVVPQMKANGNGRIVNVSSGWGSFGEGMGGAGLYGITKAALNSLTVRLSQELPSEIKVNAMCPGWVQTRMGGENADLTPEQAAVTAAWLATLPDDGPTGGFFRDKQPISW